MSLAHQLGLSNPKRVTRDVTPNSQPVTRNVTDGKTREVVYVDRAEFEALKAEVAVLRAMIEKGEVGKPATSSRAAYMREYRKRRKVQI